jgi:hypothetical protein
MRASELPCRRTRTFLDDVDLLPVVLAHFATPQPRLDSVVRAAPAEGRVSSWSRLLLESSPWVAHALGPDFRRVRQVAYKRVVARHRVPTSSATARVSTCGTTNGDREATHGVSSTEAVRLMRMMPPSMHVVFLTFALPMSPPPSPSEMKTLLSGRKRMLLPAARRPTPSVTRRGCEGCAPWWIAVGLTWWNRTYSRPTFHACTRASSVSERASPPARAGGSAPSR